MDYFSMEIKQKRNQEFGTRPLYNQALIKVMDDINTLKQPQSLMVMDDINTLKHLGRIEHYIQSVHKPDVTKYRTWNIPQMIQWISLLDDGKYCKYLSALRNGFESDSICSGEVLCELSMDNLRDKPFNIKDFMSRKQLVQHFQSLKQNNKAYM